LDVFSAERLAGNGLAVVHEADAIDDDTMVRFAREMRLSETSFIQSPGADGADYRHRIFMPTGEIPFAGHPSLGAAVAVARERGEQTATYVQETHAGLQPIDVEIHGDGATVSMLQEPAQFGDELDPEDVLGAVGLEGSESHPDLPPQFVSTGVPQLIACVADAAALGRVLPDYDALARLLDPVGALVLYLAHVDAEAGTAVARGFVGSAEVGEDPATGSACGPLCAYVAHRTGFERLEVVQGVEMGRRSVLRAHVESGGVRVGGDAVVVVDGQVLLDT
jgi:trans-2,3-dihydro-3-hydroxyanthranilate isomerase